MNFADARVHIAKGGRVNRKGSPNYFAMDPNDKKGICLFTTFGDIYRLDEKDILTLNKLSDFEKLGE